MAHVTYLAMTLVMALLGAGVVVFALRFRRWQAYTPQAAYGLEAGSGPPASGVSRLARSTAGWTAAYVLVVLGLLGSVVLALDGALAASAVVAALGLTVLAFLGSVAYAGGLPVLGGTGTDDLDPVRTVPREEPDRRIGHEEYDPLGTLALVLLYLGIVGVLWAFMYFVEFLGNGPTVIG